MDVGFDPGIAIQVAMALPVKYEYEQSLSATLRIK